VHLRVEFTIEPFVDGAPGEHVRAALRALESAGVEADFGPFGSSFLIEADRLEVLTDAVAAAMAAGASRVSSQVERAD